MREVRNQAFFSFHDTLFMKGIALLFLIWPHLFINIGAYDDMRLGDCLLVSTAATYCKLCVALFVFLSSYGLTCKAMSVKENLVSFYKRRLIKLLMNYWMIFALFCAFGILSGWRSLNSVYGDNIIPLLVYDVLGLFYAITGHAGGYNPTWWFMSCIIVLYLLFPMLYRFRRYWYILVPASLILYVYGWQVPILCSCHADLITFIMGMYCACLVEKKDIILPIDVWFYLLLFVIASIIRFYIIWPLAWDSVICITAILLYKKTKVSDSIHEKICFLGKHSFNIFLFHTFIYKLYAQELVYWTRNPLLIYLTMLLLCIMISLLIEALKRWIGYYEFQKTIIG